MFPCGTKDAADFERAYETKDCARLVEVILRRRPDEAEGVVTLLGNVLALLACPEVEILDHCAVPGYKYVMLGIGSKQHPHKGSKNEA